MFQDVVTKNSYEKVLLDEVTAPGAFGVTFNDIGALKEVKDTLKELVMLPHERPELFARGQLRKVSSLCLDHIKNKFNLHDIKMS